ncbi:Cyclin-D-binding Myb-like transcription factor 1 [Borealophlyctis nickersoniae]|nr:Cyclin-D-binding Myb-like transcription factor 1 [Borealophlyctis nickersoniae]
MPKRDKQLSIPDQAAATPSKPKKSKKKPDSAPPASDDAPTASPNTKKRKRGDVVADGVNKQKKKTKKAKEGAVEKGQDASDDVPVSREDLPEETIVTGTKKKGKEVEKPDNIEKTKGQKKNTKKAKGNGKVVSSATEDDAQFNAGKKDKKSLGSPFVDPELLSTDEESDEAEIDDNSAAITTKLYKRKRKGLPSIAAPAKPLPPKRKPKQPGGPFKSKEFVSDSSDEGNTSESSKSDNEDEAEDVVDDALLQANNRGNHKVKYERPDLANPPSTSKSEYVKNEWAPEDDDRILSLQAECKDPKERERLMGTYLMGPFTRAERQRVADAVASYCEEFDIPTEDLPWLAHRHLKTNQGGALEENPYFKRQYNNFVPYVVQKSRVNRTYASVRNHIAQVHRPFEIKENAWTPEEDALLLRLKEMGRGWREIARESGHTDTRRRFQILERKAKGKWTKQEERQLVKVGKEIMEREGITDPTKFTHYTELAAKLGTRDEKQIRQKWLDDMVVRELDPEKQKTKWNVGDSLELLTRLRDLCGDAADESEVRWDAITWNNWPIQLLKEKWLIARSRLPPKTSFTFKEAVELAIENWGEVDQRFKPKFTGYESDDVYPEDLLDDENEDTSVPVSAQTQEKRDSSEEEMATTKKKSKKKRAEAAAGADSSVEANEKNEGSEEGGPDGKRKKVKKDKKKKKKKGDEESAEADDGQTGLGTEDAMGQKKTKNHKRPREDAVSESGTDDSAKKVKRMDAEEHTAESTGKQKKKTEHMASATNGNGPTTATTVSSPEATGKAHKKKKRASSQERVIADTEGGGDGLGDGEKKKKKKKRQSYPQ